MLYTGNANNNNGSGRGNSGNCNMSRNCSCTNTSAFKLLGLKVNWAEVKMLEKQHEKKRNPSQNTGSSCCCETWTERNTALANRAAGAVAVAAACVSVHSSNNTNYNYNNNNSWGRVRRHTANLPGVNARIITTESKFFGLSFCCCSCCCRCRCCCRYEIQWHTKRNFN